MSFKLETRKWICVVSLVLLAGMFGAVPKTAGFADLVVQVGDTTASPGEQNSVISVYMTLSNSRPRGIRCMIPATGDARSGCNRMSSVTKMDGWKLPIRF